MHVYDDMLVMMDAVFERSLFYFESVDVVSRHKMPLWHRFLLSGALCELGTTGQCGLSTPLCGGEAILDPEQAE